MLNAIGDKDNRRLNELGAELDKKVFEEAVSRYGSILAIFLMIRSAWRNSNQHWAPRRNWHPWFLACLASDRAWSSTCVTLRKWNGESLSFWCTQLIVWQAVRTVRVPVPRDYDSTKFVAVGTYRVRHESTKNGKKL